MSAAGLTTELTEDRPEGAVAEMLEAQSRLRSLLAVNQSLVSSRSAGDVAQQLVEAACGTAGAGYARLELDKIHGPAAAVLEHAAEPHRLAFYQNYLEQESPPGTGPENRARGGELSEFHIVLHNGRQKLGTLQVLDRTRGGPFTELTKELLTTLAATGTLILDRTYNYDQVQRRALWMEAMRRVEELVIGSDDDELAVWSEIASSLQRLIECAAVALQVPGDNDDMHILIAAGNRAESVVGRTYPRQDSLAWRAMQEGRSQVLTSGTQLPRGRSALIDITQVGPLMAVPLIGDIGARGAVTLVREVGEPLFSDSDLELVEDFARQATVALELAEARSARYRLDVSVAREEVARELHDHVIQRLFAVGLSLQGVARAEPSTMQRQLQQTVEDLDATIGQIRETIFGLRKS